MHYFHRHNSLLSFRKAKHEWQEINVCLAELVIHLPKPRQEIRPPTPKTLVTFAGEGD